MISEGLKTLLTQPRGVSRYSHRVEEFQQGLLVQKLGKRYSLGLKTLFPENISPGIKYYSKRLQGGIIQSPAAKVLVLPEGL